jgi:hypothetical protein
MEKNVRLTKRQLNTIHDKCLSLIKEKGPSFFSFRKMRGTVGLCYEDFLEFDYRKDIIPTMLHECIHYIYPEWSETKVLYAEKRLVNHLTTLQVANFLKIIAQKIYRNELKNQ